MAWGSCYTPDYRVASVVGANTGTTAAANRRLIENLVGSPTFVIDTIDTGRYALRCSHNSAAQGGALASMISGGRYLGIMARVKVTALTTNCRLFHMIASTTTQNIVVRVNSSTGLLAYSFDNGGSYTNSAVALAAATVYRIEVFVDWGTGTTHTLKVRVDGAEVISVTGGTASVTNGGTPANFGEVTTSASMVVDYADLATYNDVAEYATVDNWRVIGLEPTSLGTSSFTDNDFQDAASANITAANIAGKNVWDYVNDAPTAAPSSTDCFKQVVTRSTAYIECVMRAMPSGYGDPKLVCLAAAMHPVASSSTNSVAFRLRALNADGTTSTEAAIDTSIASNTLEYRKHHYPTRPVTGAAWVTADVLTTPLRIRFGYSGDASPPAALDAIMAFVLAPVSATLVNGTGAGTSATSGAATGTATNHAVQGVGTGTSATAGAATGSASHHVYQGTATGTSATSGDATGVAVGTGASFVANLFTPKTDVVSSTTMTATTAVTVAAGDSAIIQAGARGGSSTAQSCSLSGLPGDAVVEKSPDISASGSPAVQMFRVYFPSGMAAGTVITFTWTQSATRKAASGQVITKLANANGIWQTATPGGTANLTAGTTAETTTTRGWHAAAWWYQSSTGTFTCSPGSDPEGTMTERCDVVVGASSFGYLYAEDHPVAAAHGGGETATATISSAAASSVGVQGVWDGAGVLISGTAAGTSATSGAASGSATVHTYQGTATATSASSAAATGKIGRYGTATGRSATAGAATGSATRHVYQGTATAGSATAGSATGSATHHVYQGTATGTSASSGAATGSATHHQYAGTATARSATAGTATGQATNHQVAGTATARSATSGAATGAATHHTYQGTATATSATTGAATGKIGRYGTATGRSATAGAATGAATHHVYQGPATGTSATAGAATGTATHHAYAGTATGRSATAGAATGAATHHAYAGAATATSATSAAATGAATHHVYQGVATGRSATSGRADVGAFGLGRSATTGAATGTVTHHNYAGTATATTATSGAATGTASRHTYQGTASGRSPTTGAATGTRTRHVYQGTATATTATSAQAVGTATRHVYQGTAAGRSATPAIAVGTATRHVYQGTGAGVSATSGTAAGMIPQHGLPVRFRSNVTQGTRYATGHRATIYATGEAGGGFLSGTAPVKTLRGGRDTA